MDAPALAPGTPVVWRDSRTLQVGFRVAVPDAPREARTALRLLDGSHSVRSAAHSAGVDVEWFTGLVVRLEEAGLLREHRTPGLVCVLAPEPWRRRLTDALSDSSHVVDRPRPSVSAAIVVAPWLGTEPQLPDGVAAVPHLLITPVPGGVAVGPFVLPGRSPCHYCCALTVAGRDAAWPMVAAQMAASRISIDSASAAWAAGLAASHVGAHLVHRTPQSVGRSFELCGGELSVREWPRHPDCPCALSVA